jgi:hypothetical protein
LANGIEKAANGIRSKGNSWEDGTRQLIRFMHIRRESPQAWWKFSMISPAKTVINPHHS